MRPAVGALTNTVGLAQQEELLLPYLDQAGIYEEDFEGGPFSKSYYSVSINIYKQYGNYFVLNRCETNDKGSIFAYIWRLFCFVLFCVAVNRGVDESLRSFGNRHDRVCCESSAPTDVLLHGILP